MIYFSETFTPASSLKPAASNISLVSASIKITSCSKADFCEKTNIKAEKH